MQQLETLADPAFQMARIDLNYDANLELSAAIKAICEQVANSIRAGHTLIVLSDKSITADKVPANAIMVTGAVHHYLIAQGIRTDANLILETGLARDSHQVAVLIGFGAT